MSYPATIDRWYDQSGITRVTSEDPRRPLFLTAFASGRGPEGFTRCYGTDFYKLFGYYMDYEKYGQAAIQAAYIVDNGGELLCKRIVASDATLGNITVVAEVSADQVQKTNAQGEPLYIDASTGQETIDAGADGANERVMINVAKIKYDLVTVPDKKTSEEIQAEIRKNEGETTFPLFTIVDNGRGLTSKRFRIEPSYNVSKTLSFMMYQLYYIGSKDLDSEYARFSMVPEIVYANRSMDITMSSKSMLQCRAISYPDIVKKFYAKLGEISGITDTELQKVDIFKGKDNKGKAINGIAVDPEGFDLTADIGFALQSGSDGSFGDKPVESEEYETQLLNFFNGTFDDDIYNLDRFKPDVLMDADYPMSVKKAIIELAEFRKDFYFFADLGTDISSYEGVVTRYESVSRSKFCSWYGQWGLIEDPFSKRHVPVTITYAMSRRIIPHLNDRRNAPYCGILYDWVFPEFLEGSINFTPKITPKVNQKEELGDMRLNYASILNDVLTLETTYTSQEELTQLSYSENVIAIQQVIKDIRDNCPKFRYSFSTTDDLEKYKKNVDEILTRYKDNFTSLEFVYVQDDIMRENKIFEADIKFTHKDFIQSELLNIYTLSTDTGTTSAERA